jgi:hypothetical protein
MKITSSDVKRFSSISIMLFAVTALLTSMPAAMAAPDPSIGGNTITQNGAGTITISVGAGTPPILGDSIRVYDQSKALTAIDGACPMSDPAIEGVTTWELRADSDTTKKIDYRFPVGSVSATSVKVNFGTGIGISGTPVTVTVDSPAELSIGGVFQGAGVSVLGRWVEVTDNAGTTGATAPSTARIGLYAVVTCGTEGGQPSEVSGNLSVVKPVAGEIIPVSTTALLLAGVSTSALWLVPLAAVAVGAFAVLRLQVLRK